MARHARTLQALVVLVLGAAPVARAEPASLSVTEENDVFCRCGLDRHYTQGLRLTLETSRAPRRTRWTLGQTIYTPGDLSRRDRIVGDRPYSGWLWLGPEFVRESPAHLRALRVYAGATGPGSLAEPAQRFVHRVIRAPEPMGWDHQLRVQLGANAFLDHAWRIAPVSSGAPFEADLMPRLGLAAGNVFDHAEAGVQARAGRLRSSPWGEPPVPSGVLATRGGGSHDAELYAVAAASARVAAYDYSLQGDHARERFDIRPRAFVWWWEAGAGLAWWHVKAEFRWIVRSPDFAPLDERQGFGSLRVAFR